MLSLIDSQYSASLSAERDIDCETEASDIGPGAGRGAAPGTKKNWPSMGEVASQGCCTPPVFFFTESPTSLKTSNTERPGWRIEVVRDSV